MSDNQDRESVLSLPGERCLTALLGLETRAARLEGAFAADPGLGQLWRTAIMLSESCRSVALEDIHVREGDVVVRGFRNHVTDLEIARGAEAAEAIMRVLAAPPDLSSDTEQGCTRLRRAGWRASTPDPEDGETAVDTDTNTNPPEGAVQAVQSAMREAPSPFLGALRAAVGYRLETDATMPAVERLVFMAADHSLRSSANPAAARGRAVGDHGLPATGRARWILTPSLALTRSGFRAWSPGTPSGFETLLDGLIGELDRGIGLLPVLRRWRTRAKETAASRHGKSRLLDLVELAEAEPILTSARVTEALGMSQRGALYLIEDAESSGILEKITPRRTYRAWAVPAIAEKLRGRASERPAFTKSRPRPEAASGSSPRDDHTDTAPLDKADWQERQQAALDELDAAMARADEILKTYATRRER